MAAVRMLSRTDARRIAVTAQLLANPRPTGVLETVRSLGCVRFDLTNAIAPSADLVLWSRIGSSIRGGDIRRVIDGQRLVELEGWPVPSDEARRIRDERRLRALGIARPSGATCRREPSGTGEAGEEAVVEGVRGSWRVDPSLLGQPFSGRAALLSPFDRLVEDRKRTTELFQFDYQLEMFKPAAARHWGYFALPILYGDRLVGKVDAATDRRASVLRVAAIHRDVPFSKSMTEAVGREAPARSTPGHCKRCSHVKASARGPSAPAA